MHKCGGQTSGEEGEGEVLELQQLTHPEVSYNDQVQQSYMGGGGGGLIL